MNSLLPWKRSDSKTAMAVAPVTQLRSDWDRLFDRVLDDFWGPGTGSATHGLAIDVSETDEHIEIRAEIPGIEPKDIDVSLSGDVLTIAGQKMDAASESHGRYHHSERRFGSFQRAVRLPVPVEPDRVDATYKNGLLTVKLEKSEALRARKIDIKS